jgi:hypothetical protein
MLKIALRALPPAGIIRARKRAGVGFPTPARRKASNGSFPGTVIDVPACTVSADSQREVKKSYLFLALIIPAGGSRNTDQRRGL